MFSSNLLDKLGEKHNISLHSNPFNHSYRFYLSITNSFMKHYFSFVGLLLVANVVFGQTLFTYGNKSVSKQDFLTAFNKNPPTKEERRKALDEYLGLYINYKLKVQAGYDEELNKQPSFVEESKNFKRQIAENVINDEVGIKNLTHEAMLRSMKDIRVAQVFVEIPKKGDTLKAYQQIMAAYKALMAGKAFGDVAVEFSSDDATKKTKGDLGYMTAFTYSYPIENEIYKLKPGTYSKPYKSSFGYHIFKNVSEKPAFGKRKVAQIMIAIPPNASEEVKKQYLSHADSIYNLIKRGEAFDKMASEYSNDYKTANNGGEIGNIGVGQYNADFERQVFALQNVGDLSKPFASAYGYHILKLLDKTLAPKDADDAAAVAATKQLVEKDERLAIFKKNLLNNKWLHVTKYKPWAYDTAAFRAYTDSNILGKITNGIKNISDTAVLFSFEKKKIHAADWAVHITKLLSNPVVDYSAMMKDFVDLYCTQYYADNLELYNESMREQTKEFDEANLLFAAMDKHVWGRTGTDIEGLKDYYSKHKQEYQWNASVTALVINTKTKEQAVEVANKLKQSVTDWHSITTNYGADVNTDSGRFEVSQLPLKQPIDNKEGFISQPEKNANADGYSFIYIIKPHPLKEQRSFEDAKGAVTNDYQQMLEKEWIASLKKKYPIVVKQAVWQTIQ